MPADTVASPAPKTAPRDHTRKSRLPFTVGTDEGMATLKQTGDSLNRVAGECMAICSDNMATAVESGTLAANLASQMGKVWMDAASCVATNMAEIGREAATCRTPADFVTVQKKAIDSMVETMTAANQMYSRIFATFGKAVDPLVARAADGPERMFRAFAD